MVWDEDKDPPAVSFEWHLPSDSQTWQLETSYTMEVLMGKSSINGGLSMAMFDCRRLLLKSIYIYTYIFKKVVVLRFELTVRWIVSGTVGHGTR